MEWVRTWTFAAVSGYLLVQAVVSVLRLIRVERDLRREVELYRQLVEDLVEQQQRQDGQTQGPWIMHKPHTGGGTSEKYRQN